MGSTEPVRLRDELTGSGPVCRMILAALPAWFGLPEALEGYVTVADRSPTVIASRDEEDVGLLTVVVRSPYAAEVYVMGVLPELHRGGIGRMMLEHAEGFLARSGIEYLQVKTLSDAKADEGYERTRAFYFSCGFRPLEELPALWGPENPAVQMVKAVRGYGGYGPDHPLG